MRMILVAILVSALLVRPPPLSAHDIKSDDSTIHYSSKLGSLTATRLDDGVTLNGFQIRARVIPEASDDFVRAYEVTVGFPDAPSVGYLTVDGQGMVIEMIGMDAVNDALKAFLESKSGRLAVEWKDAQHKQHIKVVNPSTCTLCLARVAAASIAVGFACTVAPIVPAVCAAAIAVYLAALNDPQCPPACARVPHDHRCEGHYAGDRCGCETSPGCHPECGPEIMRAPPGARD